MSLTAMLVSWLVALPVQPGQPGFQAPSPSPTPLPFGAGIFGFSFLLSTLVWVPVLGAIGVALLPSPRGRNDRYLQLIAFWVNAFLLGLAIIAYSQFQLFSTGPHSLRGRGPQIAAW